MLRFIENKTPTSTTTTTTTNLFSNKIVHIDEKDAKCWVLNNYISSSEANDLLSHIIKTVPFIRHTLYKGTSRERQQARLSCSMGQSYAYSGSIHPQSPWNERIKDIMEKVNQDFGCKFNSCLVNLYEDGSQNISPHSDDERGLDVNGQVVSISLGAERPMTVCAKDMSQKLNIDLGHGSLFMMEGNAFQKRYTHGINKTSKKIGPRVSLTFRCFREKTDKTDYTFF